MMTGTPLDLTPFGPLLTAMGLLYWALTFGATSLALWWPKSWKVKLPLAALVLAAFVYPIFRHVEARKEQHDESQARLNAAMALFQERCKGAGEKISRTVENVDGVLLLKLRPKDLSDGDQFSAEDQYGHVSGGENYVRSFLVETYNANMSGSGYQPKERQAYQFVDTVDPTNGNRLRYRASFVLRDKNVFKNGEGDFVVSHVEVTSPAPRYGVTWDDISTREDRELWIAGGSLKVIDLKTNEVVAERVGYLLDRGQGSVAGFRAPWPWARHYGPACPSIAQHNLAFVAKVLQPAKQGE